MKGGVGVTTVLHMVLNAYRLSEFRSNASLLAHVVAHFACVTILLPPSHRCQGREGSSVPCPSKEPGPDIADSLPKTCVLPRDCQNCPHPFKRHPCATPWFERQLWRQLPTGLAQRQHRPATICCKETLGKSQKKSLGWVSLGC